MQVKRLTKDDWVNFSEEAHLICFGQIGQSKLERIDFALVVDEEEIPQVYATIKEWDAETAYMQYGGAFPSAKSTTKSFQGYCLMISRLKEMGYKRATTLIENSNTAMLKFAMKVGFRIIGTKNYNNQVLLEHVIEF